MRRMRIRLSGYSFKAIFVEGLSTHAHIEIEKDEIEDIDVDDFGF